MLGRSCNDSITMQRHGNIEVQTTARAEITQYHSISNICSYNAVDNPVRLSLVAIHSVQHPMHQRAAGANEAQVDGLLLVQKHGGEELQIVHVQQTVQRRIYPPISRISCLIPQRLRRRFLTIHVSDRPAVDRCLGRCR